MRGDYARSLRVTGHERVTTEIAPAGAFYYGPDSDQQYLHKNPDALHCALVGTGVHCRIPSVARIIA